MTTIKCEKRTVALPAGWRIIEHFADQIITLQAGCMDRGSIRKVDNVLKATGLRVVYRKGNVFIVKDDGKAFQYKHPDVSMILFMPDNYKPAPSCKM